MYIKINKISYKIFACLITLFCVFVFLLTVYFDIPEKIAVVSNNKLKPIYSVDTNEKKVAISFDACWGKERTDKILNLLDNYNIKTTFFLVNIWLEDYPEKAKEIVKKGHEIGLHSSTHPKFSELSDEKIKEELTKNKEMIKNVTDYNGILFRPPFGDYNTRVIKIVQEMDIYPIQWSVDSLDWKDLSTNEIVRRVIERIKPGDIVLFHNDGKNTAEALESILKYLKMQGYTVVPISELIYKGDYYVDINGIQHGK